MIIRNALLISILALAGCEENPCPNGSIDDCKSNKELEPSLDRSIRGVRAYHDDLRSVTCWITADPRGGLSCLPDWMFTKSEVKP